jgi:predicted RNA-binding Zn-ribbon protein involved in translation (DUF1610 family)
MSSDENYLKGGCTRCGGHIEFPREALGAEVACPHCGATTALLDNLTPPAIAPASGEQTAGAAPASAGARPPKSGAAKSAPAAKGSFSRECPGCGLEVSIKARTCPACGAVLREGRGFNLKLALAAGLSVAVLAGGIFLLLRSGVLKRSDAPSTERTDAPAKPTKPVKRSGRFEVVSHQIEKTPGTSLMYVTGSVLNDTDQQKFSVRVTFALTDKNGRPAGEATDYVTVIEPGETWNFRALILDSAAENARLVSLEAENP